jgi:hypothetical protein
MPHYKSPDNYIHFLEDDKFAYLLPSGSIQITDKEFEAYKDYMNIPTWDQIRSKRDGLLTASDWSVASDATPKPSKEAWLTYRQALRDIPTTFKTPEEVVWPEKPQ